MHFLLLSLILGFTAVCSLNVPFRAVRGPQRHLPKARNVTKLGVAQLNTATQDVSVYYVGEVQIGTPPQTFVVQLDPSSPNLWVGEAASPPCHGFGCDALLQRCPGYCRDKVFCTSLCEKSCCDGSGGLIRDKYQSWESSTYKSDDNAFRSDKFGAFGEYGIDTVRIGNSQQIVISGVRFGMASESGLDLSDVPADGVLGLSTFAAGLDSTKEKPFIQQLFDSGVLEKSVYTVYLAADAKVELSGVVTYGDLDSQHCGSQISYTSMNKQNGLFEVRNISVGSAYQYSEGISTWVFSDFTKDLIGVPWDESNAVAEAYGASFDSTTYEYTVPCSSELPSLTLMVGGDTLVIPGSSLRSALKDTDEMCTLNIAQSDNWVFGSPLARSYCQVVDIGGHQIGFSAQKLT